MDTESAIYDDPLKLKESNFKNVNYQFYENRILISDIN